MEDRVPARLTAAELRRFGVVVGGAFAALTVWLQWRGQPMVMRGTAVVALALIGLGLVAPLVLGPVYRAWMGLARVMSKVTTPIVMGAIYYLVVTPVGALKRIFSRSSIVRQPVNDSYWQSRPTTAPQKRSMERPF
jgi:hypothetical protein